MRAGRGRESQNRTCLSVSTKTEVGWLVLRVLHTNLRSAVSVPSMFASIGSGNVKIFLERNLARLIRRISGKIT